MKKEERMAIVITCIGVLGACIGLIFEHVIVIAFCLIQIVLAFYYFLGCQAPHLSYRRYVKKPYLMSIALVVMVAGLYYYVSPFFVFVPLPLISFMIGNLKSA